MPESTAGPPRVLEITEAAELLHLPVQGVEALIGAGYLHPTERGPAGPRLALGDLKAFLARNTDADHPPADRPASDLFLEDPDHVDPQALIEALDGRAGEMARRTFDIFAQVFPDATGWPVTEQARFIEQAEARFEAILAVTSLGEAVDRSLAGDLERIGAAAAAADSPLPQLLVILRISRDLVVQTAVEIAEERGRHWGLALSLVLTRILPAIDRLTDSLAEGYWAAVVEREEGVRARYENVVEHSSDGIYEVDLDGRLQYANQALGLLTGRTREEMAGARLADVLVPTDGRAVESLMSEQAAFGEATALEIERPDGVRRVVEVRTIGRWANGSIVGYQGVVRDTTGVAELEGAKNEFIELVTQELRQPLTTVLGLGVTLAAYAGELSDERVTRIGRTIHLQAERMTRLADDLHDVSRLDQRSLMVTPRRVELRPTVDAAISTVRDDPDVEVDVPEGLEVIADGRRLEQVIANLVENAVEHGAPPVRVWAARDGDRLLLTVSDHGPGVPEALEGTLFTRLVTPSSGDRPTAPGLGLRLVRGLVEAMGGRVWYEASPTGGARFLLGLPAASPRGTGPGRS